MQKRFRGEFSQFGPHFPSLYPPNPFIYTAYLSLACPQSRSGNFSLCVLSLIHWEGGFTKDQVGCDVPGYKMLKIPALCTPPSTTACLPSVVSLHPPNRLVFSLNSSATQLSFVLVTLYDWGFTDDVPSAKSVLLPRLLFFPDLLSCFVLPKVFIWL